MSSSSLLRKLHIALQQQYTSFHLGLISMHSQHNDWAILKLVFGEGQRSSSFSHPFRHWNYLSLLFYSIENTVVIPVNLKVGYESTVLSRGERVQKSAEILRKPITPFDLRGILIETFKKVFSGDRQGPRHKKLEFSNHSYRAFNLQRFSFSFS
jgi:hypothetical protein